MEQVVSLKKHNIAPERVISISFVLVILAGSLLLMLPLSSRQGNFTPFLDCLFTATSATCVTGLVVYDTFTHWSTFGQGVILAMIQIGGLGLLTFTSFFHIAMGKRLGLRDMVLASESVSNFGVAGVHSLLKMIIGISFGAELAGAAVLATTFIPQYGTSQGAFISLFLAVSAFCNAGFDILGFQEQFCSLSNYTDNWVVQFTIIALIIFGGLGFIVWNDLFHWRRGKKLLLHTRIVLMMTGILLLGGALLILLFEWSNPATLGQMQLPEKLVAGLFQSTTMRTAGFNTVDIAAMREITKMVCILLMFIGAAPGSTGGGIKVTTAAVLITTALSVIRGKEEPIIRRRRVAAKVIFRALAIVFFALLIIPIATTVVLAGPVTEAATLTDLDALFETVSAFATTGVSVGVTSVVHFWGKIALIFCMYIGRIGPVSFGLTIAKGRTISKKEILPEGRIIVG